MLIVLALGGNALLKRGEAQTAAVLEANVVAAAAAVATLGREHRVVVTHGNGPQIGLLALQAAAYGEGAPFPLDILGAESEGMIGYLLEREIANELPERAVATLLTQVRVDPTDPAFRNPSKPIGPGYDRTAADALAAAKGWSFALDGERWRRVVPSPRPHEIIEIDAVRTLVAAGTVVICMGGGGVPVKLAAGGRLAGVEAVVDKDLAAALLAAELDADALLLLTDVEAVWTAWPPTAAGARAIARATPWQLDGYRFAAGSMAPKVKAACEFVRTTHRSAAIGALAQAALVATGGAGTTIHARDEPLALRP